MEKMFLHIGLPKTGTFAVQQFFFENRNKIPVLYPISVVPKGSYGQHCISVAAGKDRIRETCLLLKKEIQLSEQKVCFMSSEYLMCSNMGTIKHLNKVIEKYNTKIIFTYRNSKDYAKSIYLEWVKSLKSPVFHNINDFLNKKIDYLNYCKTLIKFKQLYGKNNLIILNYDNCKNNLIKKFFEVIEIEFENLEPIEYCNKSIHPSFIKDLNNVPRYKFECEEVTRAVELSQKMDKCDDCDELKIDNYFIEKLDKQFSEFENDYLYN
jgi:hypothetical protein